jgi:hypothetical protein
MKNIVLHIGVENTASTYLQQTFANSRDALRRVGVLYPHAPGDANHIKLAAFAMDDARGDEIRIMAGIRSPEDAVALRADFLDGLAREASESGCETMLLSNEHCASRLVHEQDIGRLKDMLAPLAETITVIVYLRRQDEAMLSMYSTAIRSGAVRKLEFPAEHVIEWKFDYEKLLARWAAVFGRQNLIVRLFSELHNGSIRDDFAIAAALPDGIDWSEPEARLNARLNAKQAEYLRILNASFPEFTEQSIARRRGNLSHVVAQVESSGVPLALPQGMAEAITERMRSSNGAVAREYFGGERAGDPLFGNVDIPPAGQPYEMTLEEFAAMTAEVWAVKNQQSQYLLRRLKQGVKTREES